MIDLSALESLFFAALEQPPAARPAFLDAACGGDAGLRARVDRLLAAQAAAGDFLAPPVTAAESTVDAVTGGADETGGAAAPTTPEAEPAFAAPTRPHEVGTLGPYRVLKELGRGGMGAVYLAFDERLKRRVALKVMLPRYAAVASSKYRFLREARAAAAIAHDHIVTVHEADERGGTPYLAMQFLQGHPLDEYAKLKGRLDLGEVLRIGREVALGLAAAHAAGLVHRDVKPGNLWVEAPTGRVKILDFGLAKPTADEEPDADLTVTGAVLGTPAFMAPEQARGEAVDFRADLFSLGVVLYRLCTARPPFHGTTAVSLLAAVLADAPTPVREYNPDVPGPFAALVHRLLEKDPAARPESAAAVAEEIRRIECGVNAAVPMPVQAIPLDGLPTLSHVAPGPDPFAGLDATEADDGVARPPAPKRPRGRRPRWPLVALGAAALALALLVPQIIKVVTPKGVLVIETSDPDVEVVVKQGGATIVDKTRRREIALAVGDDYQIDLAEAKDGLKLSTGKFEITKGGKTTVTVRVEKEQRAAAKAVDPAGGFLEVHGVTRAALDDWVAKLPKGYRPSWLAARPGGAEPTFDAVAVPSTDAVDVKLVDWSEADRAAYDAATKTHCLIVEAPYLVAGRYQTLSVGVKAGRPWDTWFGSQEFVAGKIADGQKLDRAAGGVRERWLPLTASAVQQADGSTTYSLASTWQPARGLDWHPALDAKALAGKVAECRANGWRPHVVNAVHGRPGPTFLAAFIDNPAAEGWDFTPDLSVAGYEKELTARRAKGQRPRCVCPHAVGGEAGYTVVWDGGPAPEPTAAFLEVHAATLPGVQDWAAKLPKAYRITWLTSHGADPETRFTAVAARGAAPADTKLVFWPAGDNAPYEELIKTHRVALGAPNGVGGGNNTLLLGVLYDEQGTYWYGGREFIAAKVAEGLAASEVRDGVTYRWLPVGLAAHRTDDVTSYELISSWLPDRGCEWHPDLDAADLAAKAAEYRKKGWRPHVVNAHVNRTPARYVAVFTEDKEKVEWDFTPDLSAAAYEKELAARAAKNQHPRCVAVGEADGKTGYTVVWEGDATQAKK